MVRNALTHNRMQVILRHIEEYQGTLYAMLIWSYNQSISAFLAAPVSEGNFKFAAEVH